jgi:hypothetical protein
MYGSLNIIWVIMSRRMRRPRQVALIGKRRSAYRILMGKLEGNKQLGKAQV